MRILYVLHTFPPEGKGGTELYALGLLKALQPGHEVAVFYRSANRFRPEYEVTQGRYEGISYTSVNYNFRDFKEFRDTYENERIEEIFSSVLARFKPDVVHVHHLTGLGLGLLPVIREKSQAAVVLTVHDLWFSCAQGQMMRLDLKRCETIVPSACAACRIKDLGTPWTTRFWPSVLNRLGLALRADAGRRKLLDFFWSVHEKYSAFRAPAAARKIEERQMTVLRALEEVDLILLPSQALYRQVVEAGFPEKKMVLAPKGVDPVSLPDEKKRTSKAFRAAYLGTLIPSKGVHDLIEAFRALKAPDASLELHGPFVAYDGFSAYEAALRKMAGKDPRIQIKGAYGREDLPRILSGVDLLVVPSLWLENRPLVIEEALRAKIPVAASRLPGMTELIREGENGLLFNPGDPADLRRVLELFQAHPDSVLTAPGIGRRGLKTTAEDAAFHDSLYERLFSSKKHTSLRLHNP